MVTCTLPAQTKTAQPMDLAPMRLWEDNDIGLNAEMRLKDQWQPSETSLAEASSHNFKNTGDNLYFGSTYTSKSQAACSEPKSYWQRTSSSR